MARRAGRGGELFERLGSKRETVVRTNDIMCKWRYRVDRILAMHLHICTFESFPYHITIFPRHHKTNIMLLPADNNIMSF